MSISTFTSYASKLLPQFSSSKVKDVLSDSAVEIENYTLESANRLNDIFPGTYVWKNKQVAKLDSLIISNFDADRARKDGLEKTLPLKPNSIEVIRAILVNMMTAVPYIHSRVDDSFETTVSNSGLTYPKALLLQYTETVEFFLRFTRKYLNYVSSAELSALADNRQPVEGVGPDDLEYLATNTIKFVNCASIMCVSVKKLKEGLGRVPDVVIDASNESVVKVVVGANKTDPFGFTTLPFPLSFIFNVQLAFANWQVDRLKEAQHTAKAIEYRIILLEEQIQSGKSSVHTEKLLTLQNERLAQYKRKIEKMEGEYVGNQ